MLTCPDPNERAVVGVSWEAAVGQVEQRRSLSLLDHGTHRGNRSRMPAPVVLYVTSAGPKGHLMPCKPTIGRAGQRESETPTIC